VDSKGSSSNSSQAGGGNEISFSHTPQAADDLFPATASGAVVMDLDVMANDLGGNAKTLYSVDSGDHVDDLLTRDASGAAELSARGASVSIAGGVFHYDASALSSELQSLPSGESFEDSFIYAIQLGNGTLSWATATVRVSGVNELALMVGSTIGSTDEDAISAVTGALMVIDADYDQSHAESANGTTASGGQYSVASDGQWSYVLANAAFQPLAQGATAVDAFEVKSIDGSAVQLVTITIAGVNDAASIGGAVSGNVAEAGPGNGGGSPAVSGNLVVADVDDGESAARAASGTGDAGFGVYAVDASGHWSYTLDDGNAAVDALNDGDQLVDSFTVWSLDGSATATVTIAIVGADDGLSLFTEDADNVDFNALAVGSYIEGTQYGALGGADTVWLPSDQSTAVVAGYDPSYMFRVGDGNDIVIGGGLADMIDGESGNDRLIGGSGNNFLSGGSGSDKLRGGLGSDILDGGSARDWLHGGLGKDELTGGSGHDYLRGGAGNDVLSGGDGNDAFGYINLSDRGSGRERIVDFTVSGPSADKLYLHELLDGFSGYDGSNAYTGGYLRLLFSGGSTIVQVDSTGGGDGYVNLVTTVNTILDPASILL
jgi:VCBS repeat-containing protein